MASPSSHYNCENLYGKIKPHSSKGAGRAQAKPNFLLVHVDHQARIHF